MTPSYGISSGYELCENQPMSDANEEYFESEKYEIKQRDFSQPGSLVPFVARLKIRRDIRPSPTSATSPSTPPTTTRSCVGRRSTRPPTT